MSTRLRLAMCLALFLGYVVWPAQAADPAADYRAYMQGLQKFASVLLQDMAKHLTHTQQVRFKAAAVGVGVVSPGEPECPHPANIATLTRGKEGTVIWLCEPTPWLLGEAIFAQNLIAASYAERVVRSPESDRAPLPSEIADMEAQMAELLDYYITYQVDDFTRRINKTARKPWCRGTQVAFTLAKGRKAIQCPDITPNDPVLLQWVAGRLRAAQKLYAIEMGLKAPQPLASKTDMELLNYWHFVFFKETLDLIIAHELGHIVDDSLLTQLTRKRTDTEDLQIEMQADKLGLAILQRQAGNNAIPRIFMMITHLFIGDVAMKWPKQPAELPHLTARIAQSTCFAFAESTSRDRSEAQLARVIRSRIKPLFEMQEWQRLCQTVR